MGTKDVFRFKPIMNHHLRSLPKLGGFRRCCSYYAGHTWAQNFVVYKSMPSTQRYLKIEGHIILPSIRKHSAYIGK